MDSLFTGKKLPPGSENECEHVISSVFSKLQGLQKYCKILLDEIYIKPATRYCCHHIIGFSVDEPEKPARTALAISTAPMMGAPMMGAPAIVACLFPLLSLTGTFLRANFYN